MNRNLWHVPSVIVAGLMLATMGLLGQAASAQDTEDDTDSTQAAIQMVVRADGQGDGERLVVEAEPGEQTSFRIYVGNRGEETLSVMTFTADISTQINGGLQIGEEGSDRLGTSAWIDYPTEVYDLEPGTEVGRDVPLTVPDDLGPGEYAIPIAVETVDAFPIPGSEMLLQKIRKVLVVYVVLPGDPQPGFEFDEPTIEYVQAGTRQLLAIRVPIVNTGQTTIRLFGELRLNDSAGVTVINSSIVMGAIYGKHDTVLQHVIGAPLSPGIYTLSLELKDDVSGVSNGFEESEVTVPEAPTDQVVPLAFGGIIIASNADPIQFAGAVVEIINNGQVLRSARLVMIVELDGVLLEEFNLAENLTLEQGVTTVAQRYLPLTGWEPGTYTFSLRLETVDSSSGAASVLLTQEDVATIEVPD
jgi:hypothetical protein